MTVSVVADYLDHNSYLSPIGVPDLPNWDLIYGFSIQGSATDNGDGTMAASVTVKRAGSYLLTVLVNGADVIGSPYSFLDIQPTTISGPACIEVGAPPQIMAGFDYSFEIQGRD